MRIIINATILDEKLTGYGIYTLELVGVMEKLIENTKLINKFRGNCLYQVKGFSLDEHVKQYLKVFKFLRIIK